MRTPIQTVLLVLVAALFMGADYVPPADTIPPATVTPAIPGGIRVIDAGAPVDLLNGAGAFNNSSGWTVSGWTVSNGVASCTSGASRTLRKPFGAQVGSTYRVSYDVISSSTGGTLTLSRYGFGNATLTLDKTVGQHSVDVLCKTASDLRISASSWAGSIDNVTITQVQ